MFAPYTRAGLVFACQEARYAITINWSFNLKILAIFAHPDDETMLCGGLLALASSTGHSVHVVSATRGEGGDLGSRPCAAGLRPEQYAHRNWPALRGLWVAGSCHLWIMSTLWLARKMNYSHLQLMRLNSLPAWPR